MHGLVKKEMEEHKIPLNRIVLSGFSQGGAMALFSGLTMMIDEERELGQSGGTFAGVISLSAYIPIRKYVLERLTTSNSSSSNPNLQIPILMCHGTDDSVVSYDWGKRSQEFLSQNGVSNISFKPYQGLDHGSCMAEMQDVLYYLVDKIGKPSN